MFPLVDGVVNNPFTIMELNGDDDDRSSWMMFLLLFCQRKSINSPDEMISAILTSGLLFRNFCRIFGMIILFYSVVFEYWNVVYLVCRFFAPSLFMLFVYSWCSMVMGVERENRDLNNFYFSITTSKNSRRWTRLSSDDGRTPCVHGEVNNNQIQYLKTNKSTTVQHNTTATSHKLKVKECKAILF